MAAKSTTATCCLTLPLKLEKWQEDRLAKRFEIARQLYNTLVGAELKKLHKLERTPEYRENQRKLRELYANGQESTPECRALGKKRSKFLNDCGFSEYGFKTAMKDYYKHFNQNIGSSVAMHGIAPQVWQAFEKKLYGNGEKVHFKRLGEVNSVRGYSKAGKSGGVEIMYRGTYIEWKGLKLPIKQSPNNDYETRMQTHRVKYVRLLRKPGKNKDRWYAQLTLEGIPEIKYNSNTGEPIHPVGKGIVGIDIGPQTLAYSAKTETGLLELADRVRNIEDEKRRIQRKMDRSRRATNPDNYAEDGTIRRGVKLTRNKSQRYLILQRELAYLQHQQAEIRKMQHTELANRLISLGDTFYVEDMEWPSLTHRAKKTEISEKTGRFKRKKRFGKSVANKAPAMLITLLANKCQSLGLPGVVRVPTSVKASQYNHQSDTYEKKSLSQRWNKMPDGGRIQRDIYSAFLLQHMNPDLKGFDKKALEEDYPQFVRYHDETIQELSKKEKTLTSMGIAQTAS